MSWWDDGHLGSQVTKEKTQKRRFLWNTGNSHSLSEERTFRRFSQVSVH